jgi:hypothetical protein
LVRDAEADRTSASSGTDKRKPDELPVEQPGMDEVGYHLCVIHAAQTEAAMLKATLADSMSYLSSYGANGSSSRIAHESTLYQYFRDFLRSTKPYAVKVSS